MQYLNQGWKHVFFEVRDDCDEQALPEFKAIVAWCIKTFGEGNSFSPDEGDWCFEIMEGWRPVRKTGKDWYYSDSMTSLMIGTNSDDWAVMLKLTFVNE